ncbi:MAG: glycerol-3-phosphate 1-O-acyltransferase PlsY [Devosia sp.]|nr:glycerol-3-phosphate 1-O-acyltransferase PlsY [Devosia sp.]
MIYQALIFAAGLGYLLGSIPFGFILTRAAGLGDIRSIGSGNIGATNVLRTGNKALAAATLAFDAGKGAAAVLLARWLWGEDAAMIAGIAAFLGHVFPVWLGFKGGKGVATYIGVMLGLNWIVGLIFCATWLVIAFAQKYSSLAALTAAATAPIFAYVVSGLQLAAAAGVLSIVLMARHWANIRRLWSGTEPRIGGEKPKAE